MQLGRNRVEALTDGVFAVAMTLLVLDIKVPELAQELASAELPYRLLALWPKFLSYAISFVILGVYWVGHHLQLSFIRSADRPLLWINILFLLWVALVPFSTALLSEYTKNRLAIAVYAGNMIAIGLTLALHGGTPRLDAATSIQTSILAWFAQPWSECSWDRSSTWSQSRFRFSAPS